MNNKVCIIIVLSSCIGLLLSGPAAGQRKTSVNIPVSGVVQQTSMPSYLNAVWIQQAVADFLDLDQQAIVQKMLDGNIRYVFVQVGNWHQSNDGIVSIDYWLTPSVMQSIVNSIHSYSNNKIQVHAWMLWSIPDSQGGVMVNLADAEIRAQAVNTAVNCVQTYGFDGFNDDLVEGFAGTDSDYVAFANALGIALSSINKVSSVDLPSPWGWIVEDQYATLYTGITDVDYICPMLYGGWDDGQWNEGNTKQNLQEVLDMAGTQVLAGLCVTRIPNGFTLSDILGWIEHPSSSKFAGVSLFNLLYIQTDDWTALSNWV